MKTILRAGVVSRPLFQSCLICSVVAVWLASVVMAAEGSGQSGSPGANTFPSVPENGAAGDLLERRAKVGLDGCPINKCRKVIKSWKDYHQATPSEKGHLTWLPKSLVGPLYQQLDQQVVALAGPNSRALFYFAFPDTKTASSLQPMTILNATTNSDINTLLSLFLTKKNDPLYQLSSVPGAVTADEVGFLYANSTSAVYRSSCLGSIRAALNADVRFSVASIGKVLEGSSRQSRSALLVYGDFQSPVWSLLAGKAEQTGRMEALLGIYAHYLENGWTVGRIERFVSGFSGWLVFYVEDSEISSSLQLKTGAGFGLGVASLNGSLDSALTSSERIQLKSYELLVDPNSIHFADLPLPDDIQSAWKDSPLSHVSKTVPTSKQDRMDVVLEVPGVPQTLCSRITESTPSGTNASGLVLNKTTFEDSRCRLHISAPSSKGQRCAEFGIGPSLNKTTGSIPKIAVSVAVE